MRTLTGDRLGIPGSMKSKMIKLLLGLASTTVILTIVEVGLRLSDYDPNTSPWYRFDPALGWTLDPVHRRVPGLNSRGFRSPEVNRIKPEGTRRLLNLGDSFSAGMNVAYGETYPGLLADWLSRNEESWEVINLAVGDWGTNQQLIALQTLGLELKPDVVVLQVFPFNDLCNNSAELAHTCSLQDLFRPYLDPAEPELRPVFLNPVRADLRARFRIFGLVEERGVRASLWLQELRPGEPGSTNRYYLRHARQAGLSVTGALASLLPGEHQPRPLQRAWDDTVESLNRVKRLLDQQEIPLIALVIPYKWTLSKLWPQYSRGKPEALDPRYGTNRVEGVLEGLGATVISARRSIEASTTPVEEFFLTDSHFSPAGHALVAGRILDEMHKAGWTRNQPPEQEAGSVRAALSRKHRELFECDPCRPD